jgi:hypothetical protein
MLAELALSHCDMGFAMVCDKGYMVGLNTAAKALNLQGKTEGMNGALAPILWNPPKRDLTDKELADIHALGVTPGTSEARKLCVEYVEQDAITTRDVYRRLMEEGSLIWRTRRGSLARYPWVPYVLNGHIATVKEALALDPPDTSWMSNPRSRGDYIGWTLNVLGLDSTFLVNPTGK